ncbi:MAG: hypothetical protein FWG31_07935 [Oscillospiraceae bacterium]|nr:hypothetical protein [Oscillospiraceae bacterium]
MYAFWIDAVSTFGIFLTSFYIFKRSVGYKPPNLHTVMTVQWSLLAAYMYACGYFWLPAPTVRPVFCAASVLLILLFTMIEKDTAISAYLLAFGGSYIFYYAGILVVGIIFMPIAGSGHIAGSVIQYDELVYPLMYSLAAVFNFGFAVLFFKIRRFQKGFDFLLKGYTVIVSLIVAGAMLVVTAAGQNMAKTDDASTIKILIAGIAVIAAGVYIWIRRGIKAAYLRWAKENNDDLYRQAIAEKDEEIRRLTEFSDNLRAANHSIIHRVSAMELGYAAMLSKAKHGVDMAEFAEELAAHIEDARRLMRDYRKDAGRVKQEKVLPETNLPMLDNLFRLFARGCAAEKISFDLVINGSIRHMVTKVVDQSKLETMIGDHVQDALFAVVASDKPFRSVLVTLGLAGEHYALTVFDSGIEFEPSVLARLGTERVTTRAETGGSGEGFMKTFETMRECGASLIISEKARNSAVHTKSVTIRFDGKGQYIIETHRPDQIPQSDRYTILGQSGK